VSFFDYPQEHWIHLRTTNIVESPFNAVRLRTDASRRFKKTENAEAIESGSCSWWLRNPGARSTRRI
jgi:transposase-like protein